MAPTAQDFINQMLAQEGDPYVFGAEVDLNDPNPPRFDCSELTQWASHRVGAPLPDGAYYQWRHTIARDTDISVAQAIKTPGALLFMGDGTGIGRDAITHVAASLGNGYTIEARGSKWGVGVFTATRGFDFAGLVPGIDYSGKPVPPPAAKVRTVLKKGDKGPDVGFAQGMFQILLKDPAIYGRYVSKSVADSFKADQIWGDVTGGVNERIEDFWNSEGPGQDKPLDQDAVWTMAGTAPAVAAMVTMSLARR